MRPLLPAFLAVLALSAGDASAHAKLSNAAPAAGATVKTGFTNLELTFNEAVEPALSVIEVLDGQGQTVLSSKGQAVCAEAACKMVLPPLTAGDFTVKYHVLSVDGHVVEGSYDFHVAD
jgi:methionine-rich copper-binding protein CopC